MDIDAKGAASARTGASTGSRTTTGASSSTRPSKVASLTDAGAWNAFHAASGATATTATAMRTGETTAGVARRPFKPFRTIAVCASKSLDTLITRGARSAWRRVLLLLAIGRNTAHTGAVDAVRGVDQRIAATKPAFATTTCARKSTGGHRLR